MYGLPKNFDGSFLVGRTLEGVWFRQFLVNLDFGDTIHISIEGAFGYGDDAIANAPVRESNLMRSIGSSVEAATGEADGTLILHFSDGKTLRIFDSSPQYESYSITFGDKTIRV